MSRFSGPLHVAHVDLKSGKRVYRTATKKHFYHEVGFFCKRAIKQRFMAARNCQVNPRCEIARYYMSKLFQTRWQAKARFLILVSVLPDLIIILYLTGIMDCKLRSEAVVFPHAVLPWIVTIQIQRQVQYSAAEHSGSNLHVVVYIKQIKGPTDGKQPRGTK